jgi:alpha-L-fucosidase
MSDWFKGAGLGLFIHWDHASSQGLEIGWSIGGEAHIGDKPLHQFIEAIPHARTANLFHGKLRRVTLDQYNASAANFDPVAWNPEGLADLAKRAGVQYAVLTTKHHSGYCLFHTRTTTHSIEYSAYRKDIVRQFAGAMRNAGIRVGFYFSLSDWSHPDYPRLTPELLPYRFAQTPPFPGELRWERFLEDMFAQLRELLSGYGKIDVLWFDGGWERPPELWRSAKIEELVRSLQPDIVLNDRLPGVAGYKTPEQFVPAAASTESWETCMTIGESWGYDPDDTDLKDAREIIHRLAEVVSRGGNLLLNVSPMGNGALPPAQVERLERIGTWMARHAESVIGVEPGLEAWQFGGMSTRRADRVYLILPWRPYDSVTVRGIPLKSVRSVSCLGTAEPLDYKARFSAMDAVLGDPSGEMRIAVPERSIDEEATVIVIDFD